MSCDVGEVPESLENQNELWRRWSDWKLGEWALLILQAFRRFTYVIAHSTNLPLLYPRHSSFSNPSVASPTSQLILQLFFRFSYVSCDIGEAFSHFTYVTANSTTLPSLYPRHSSFSNPSVASPTSQLILKLFFRFSYVTGFSLTSPGEPPMFHWCMKMKHLWKAVTQSTILYCRVLFNKEVLWYLSP